jgi:hypothetical protein
MPEELVAWLGAVQAQDFAGAKWSLGLRVTEARRGLDAVKSDLQNEVIGGQSLWFSASVPQAKSTTPAAYLLSIYDEFVSGYKDRRVALIDGIAARLKSLGNAVTYIMLVNYQFAGAWKPVLEKDTVLVRASRFASLFRTETQALAKAARKYGEFLALKVRLSMDFDS